MYALKQKLIATALGDAYYGEALYEALNLVFNKNDKDCLERWLRGLQTCVDHIQLQQIANQLP